MKLRQVHAITLCVILMGSGACITTSGDQLRDIAPSPPHTPRSIEQTVGKDFSFHLDGGKMVTSNKMGRIINDEILGRWMKKGFITGHQYVKSSQFTGNSRYNLTLSGHQEGNSSIVLQIISGLTLFILPYYVTTEFDLRYTIEDTETGKTFSSKASDSYTMIGPSWILLPVAPFAQGGSQRTFERLSDHLYLQLAEEDAFQ